MDLGTCRFDYGALCDLSYQLNTYYTGSVEAPTLLPGTYMYSTPQGNQVTVVATDIPDAAPTPEPSGVALLGTGFLTIAFMMRKRLQYLWSV